MLRACRQHHSREIPPLPRWHRTCFVRPSRRRNIAHARKATGIHRLFGVSFLAAALLAAIAAGCGDANDGSGGASSNKARFTFDCVIAGFPGSLTLDVEAIGQSGITWGPGPNPMISGVIGTGEYTLYTTGTLTLPDRTYSISGENQFADFWSSIPGDRFTVEWQPSGTTMLIVWDWFNPAPATYQCDLTGSRYL
ncbi:MAG: hypothetical protein ACN4G0_14495 [Polyangiales bacterium]